MKDVEGRYDMAIVVLLTKLMLCLFGPFLPN